MKNIHVLVENVSSLNCLFVTERWACLLHANLSNLNPWLLNGRNQQHFDSAELRDSRVKLQQCAYFW